MTRTIQQIINDVDNRFSNSATLSSKIEWANIVLKEIYPYVGKRKIAETLTVANQPFYKLYDSTDPEFELIEYDQIESITVNGEEYRPLNINEKVYPNCFYRVDDTVFGINPVPIKNNLKIHIIYRKRPDELTDTNTSAVPEIDEDFYELLKYGIMRITAEAEQDMISRNNYANTYNEILRDARFKKDNDFSAYYSPTDVMPKSGYRRNSRTRTVSEEIYNGI